MRSIFWISLAAVLVLSYNGVDSVNFDLSSCLEMKPLQMTGEPQSKPPIFKFNIEKKKYKSGDSIKVSLRSERPIQAFMISARLADKSLDRGKSFGHFKAQDIQTKSICTDSYGSSLTSVKTESRQIIQLEWTSQASTKGHIVFLVSVVYASDLYWLAEKSEWILDETSPPPPKSPDSSSTETLSTLTTSGCGSVKGCFRNPPDCQSHNCDIILTWTHHKDYTEFQLLGDTEGWVGVTFSKEHKLSETYDSIECSWDSARNQVMVNMIRTRNGGSSEVNRKNSLNHLAGWNNDRRVYCTFRHNAGVTGQKRLFGERKYLMLSKGRVDEHGRKIFHEQELSKYPYVSPKMVRDTEMVDLSGTLRYPLVKIHGCLMVIAWMVCAMTGLLVNKYYRAMWPNSRWCNKRVWYSAYMMCMVTCLILTVISFIVIFVHGNGYIQLPIYPNKAHPPIGICVTILIFLIPILAICRPTEPNPSNGAGICINWILWLLETAVSVLATVNLFIGLNLPKAHVPWWTSWVMVAFFLFHLIVELMLEIHGCLNSKKQHAKYEKFVNQGKPRNELEPEPVGRNFKQNLLVVYLFVSVVLGLIIVISIACG